MRALDRILPPPPHTQLFLGKIEEVSGGEAVVFLYSRRVHVRAKLPTVKVKLSQLTLTDSGGDSLTIPESELESDWSWAVGAAALVLVRGRKAYVLSVWGD